MSAFVVDGGRLADELRLEVEGAVAELSKDGVTPGLATVLVGDDYAAEAYERRVRRVAGELGCRYVGEQLPGDVRIEASEEHLYRQLHPLKDVEAVHPENAGLLALGEPRYTPSTPASVFWLLDRYVEESGRDPATFYNGLDLVLVGRSNNVGKPALWLGLARGATVVSCHRLTAQAGRLEEHTRQADILVVAAGVPGFVTGAMVKEGVIAVDVGINPVSDEETGKVRLVGDLDFVSVAEKAEAITPVPGGVGPITDVWLLRNTAEAARIQAGPRGAR